MERLLVLVLFGHLRTIRQTSKQWNGLLSRFPRTHLIVSTWHTSTPVEKSWHFYDEEPEQVTKTDIESLFYTESFTKPISTIIEEQNAPDKKVSTDEYRGSQMYQRIYCGLKQAAMESPRNSVVLISRPDILIRKSDKLARLVQSNITAIYVCVRPLTKPCIKCGLSFTTWDLLWIVPYEMLNTLISRVEVIMKEISRVMAYQCEHDIFTELFSNLPVEFPDYFYGRDFRILRSLKKQGFKDKLLLLYHDRRRVFYYTVSRIVKSSFSRN